MANASFVKFVRGTTAAYTALTTKNSDTLYFISDDNSNQGKLYLGSKLISGTSSGTDGVSNLSELLDVALTSIANSQILRYDSSLNKWVNSTINDILSLDTKSLVIDSDNKLGLYGFKTASVGTIPQVSNTGVLTWVAPSTLVDLTNVNTAITNLQTTVATHVTEAEVNTLIANANHLKRAIATDLTEVTDSNTIYFVRNTETTGNNLYDEYMVINDTPEKISSGVNTMDLSGYVTTTELNTIVGTLATKTEVNNLSTVYAAKEDLDDYLKISVYTAEVGNLDDLIFSTDDGTTLVDQVNDLTDRLMWHEMTE